jgi:curli production assembly/transport component CsgF
LRTLPVVSIDAAKVMQHPRHGASQNRSLGPNVKKLSKEGFMSPAKLVHKLGGSVKYFLSLLTTTAGLAFAAAPASASSLGYTPVSPSFGGNPLNGTYVLSLAQAQGLGAKSGSNSPDLSGLNAALSGLGSGTGTTIVIGGTSSNPTIPTTP